MSEVDEAREVLIARVNDCIERGHTHYPWACADAALDWLIAAAKAEALREIPKHPRSTDGEFIIVPAAWFDGLCSDAESAAAAAKAQVEEETMSERSSD